MSGFTIMRRVWLFACGMVGGVAFGSNGNARVTRRGAGILLLPVGSAGSATVMPAKVPDGAVIQVATHFFPLAESSFARAPAATSSAAATSTVKLTLLWFVMRVSLQDERVLCGAMQCGKILGAAEGRTARVATR